MLRPCALILHVCLATLVFTSTPAILRAAPSSSISANHEALPIDDAQEQALLGVAGDDFKIFRTPHFIIAYNTDRGLVESLSARLEQTYICVSRFCERSGFPLKSLDRRLEVVFLDTWPDYLSYGRQLKFDAKGTYGFYYEGNNRSAFFNVENDPTLLKMHATIVSARENVGRMEDTVKSIRGNQILEITYPDGRRKRVNKVQAKQEVDSARRHLKTLDAQQQNYCDRINRTVVQHETAHQVLYNIGVHVRGGANPRWLVEGLACIFETPPGADGGGLAAINQARLKDFRMAVTGNSNQVPTPALYAEAVKEHRMVSIRELLRKSDLFDERGNRGAINYAAAWALIHYLHRTQNKALPGYLRDVASRRPGQSISPDEELALFEKHFGPVDDAFAARFSNYILRLPVRAAPGEF